VSVCQKREIRIEPRVGCNLKDMNCPVWNNVVVHDITNTEILLIFDRPQNATLFCEFQRERVVTLTLRQLITLNVKCSLKGLRFEISKMSYRQMHGPNVIDQLGQGLSFSDELDFLTRNHKQNVLSFMKGTARNISELEQANDLLAENIEKHTNRSEKVWAEATGGMSGTEQIAMWSSIAGCLGLSILTMICLIKLRGGEDVVSDLRNRILDLEADFELNKPRPNQQTAVVPRQREQDNTPNIEEAD